MIMSVLEMKLFSSLAKVFPQKVPVNEPAQGWLCALYDETISFQAAYRYTSDNFRTWVKLEVDIPPGIDISIRRVRSVPGSFPVIFKSDKGYISTEDGLFPDLLEPFDVDRVPLFPGAWQSLWISVTATQNAADGIHPVSVSLKSYDGTFSAAVETTIEIIPASLPALHIPHTRWFHIDGLASYYDVEVYSEAHWKIIESFAAFAVKHGMNTLLTPIHTPPLDTEVGGERLTTQLIDVDVKDGIYTFTFDKLERWVSMCKRVGVEYYEMAHLFTQWGAKHAPKIMGTKNGEYRRLFGWETDASGSDYTDYLRQMLPALICKLEELDIKDKTIFHISDEPNIDHMDAYMHARKIVEPLLKGFKIVDALTNYDFYKKGAVSIPIPSVDHITPFLEGNIPELWCYYCCAQSYEVPNHFMMLPSYRNRILGTLLYKFDIAGFLHWGFNFYNCVYSVYPIDPFLTTDADGAFPSGDAFIVYPGPDGEPYASLRLMVAQEAFNDLRALKLLEKLSGRETVLTMIDDDLSEPLTFSQFPQNDEYLLNLRKRINDEIKKKI